MCVCDPNVCLYVYSVCLCLLTLHVCASSGVCVRVAADARVCSPAALPWFRFCVCVLCWAVLSISTLSTAQSVGFVRVVCGELNVCDDQHHIPVQQEPLVA